MKFTVNNKECKDCKIEGNLFTLCDKHLKTGASIEWRRELAEEERQSYCGYCDSRKGHLKSCSDSPKPQEKEIEFQCREHGTDTIDCVESCTMFSEDKPQPIKELENEIADDEWNEHFTLLFNKTNELVKAINDIRK